MSRVFTKFIHIQNVIFYYIIFIKTTHRQIAAESGIGLGTITYHYKVKEDMLKVLIEELEYEKIAKDMFERFVNKLNCYCT